MVYRIDIDGIDRHFCHINGRMSTSSACVQGFVKPTTTTYLWFTVWKFPELSATIASDERKAEESTNEFKSFVFKKWGSDEICVERTSSLATIVWNRSRRVSLLTVLRATTGQQKDFPFNPFSRHEKRASCRTWRSIFGAWWRPKIPDRLVWNAEPS